MCDRLLLLAAILAQRWHPVVSSGALDHLHWAMLAVLYRRTDTAIKKACKVGACFVIGLFAVALAAAGAIQSK